MVAHGQQHGNQRGQRQFARAGEGVGMVGMPRQGGELSAVQVGAELREKGVKG